MIALPNAISPDPVGPIGRLTGGMTGGMLYDMDTLSKARRSEVMGRIRGKDTKPELIVRSLLHRAGAGNSRMVEWGNG